MAGGFHSPILDAGAVLGGGASIRAKAPCLAFCRLRRMYHIPAATPIKMPPIATPIPVPICAPVDSPALEAEEVPAAAELVEVAKMRLPLVDSSDEVSAESPDNVAVESAEDVVVASFEEAVVVASEAVSVGVSEAVVAVVDEDVGGGVGVGVAAAEELRPAVVAARSDISKDQLSEFAPLPTAAPALGFKLNQHGVSEPDHESLMRAVLLKPATP